MILRSGLYNERIALRDLTREILTEEGLRCVALDARGEGPLAQIMCAVLFGDYVSYYLAMQNGIDPSPNPNLDRHKRRLASA